MKSSFRSNGHRCASVTRWFCTRFVAMLALLGGAATTDVRAQSPEPLSIPNLQLQQNGSVFAAVTLADGSTIVGGTFTSFDSVPRLGLAKFQAAGTLDPTFAPAVTGSSFAVYAIAVDGSNGDIYVGGNFSAVDGVPRGNLAKLHADGSLDLAWTTAVLFSSPGVEVLALALDGAGDLFIGHTTSGGLAKASTSGAGAFDPSWNIQTDGDVYALAFDGTSLFIGGIFNNIYVGNDPVPRNFLAKVSPSGSLDTTWLPKPDDNDLYSDPTNDIVYSLALDGSGHLYVGGQFSTINGDPGGFPGMTTGPGFYCHGMVRLSTSGSSSPDSTWLPTAGNATAIQPDGSGHIYVGNLNGAARVSTSGTGTTDATWHPTFDGAVYALASAQGGGIYAGGAFQNAGGARHWGLSKIVSTGVVSASTPDAEVSGQVYALAPLADGSMIVGGTFLKSGQVLRKNILRMQADGSLDATWNPSADQTVLSLAADGAGSVYVGGSFTHIGGQARSGVAKLSATGAGTVAAWNPSPNGPVYALALDAGSVYLGGNFLQVGAQTYNGGLARVSASTGAVDTGWIPFTGDPTADGGNVNALAIDSGYLYAGGQFSDSVGTTDYLNYVVRYPTAGNGAPDATWNTPAPDFEFFDTVNALYADGAGSVFIGGHFTNFGQQPNINIAKLSTDAGGAADATWNPAPDADILALLPDGNGNLYVGGGFSTIGGSPRRSIARISASGSGAADATWNPTADDLVRVLVSGSANGDIYSGGDFVGTGTEPRFGLAAFAPDVLFSNGFGNASL